MIRHRMLYYNYLDIKILMKSNVLRFPSIRVHWRTKRFITVISNKWTSYLALNCVFKHICGDGSVMPEMEERLEDDGILHNTCLRDRTMRH